MSRCDRQDGEVIWVEPEGKPSFCLGQSGFGEHDGTVPQELLADTITSKVKTKAANRSCFIF